MRIPRVETARTEDGWLALRRGGMSARDIARECGYKLRAVQLGIANARLREGGRPTQGPLRQPELVPLFPIEAFTPQVACPHHRPIATGSSFCCMVCHQSGKDHYASLRRNPETDPKPEPKAPPKPERKRTRRERRSIMDYLEPSPN